MITKLKAGFHMIADRLLRSAIIWKPALRLGNINKKDRMGDALFENSFVLLPKYSTVKLTHIQK